VTIEFEQDIVRAVAAGLHRRGDDLEQLLRDALQDSRHEVRSKVIDAILEFRLDGLSGQLMQAFQRDRSRKGRSDIKRALRHFNTRPEVIEFGRVNRFGQAFLTPPTCVHDWEASREGWIS
jgi:hypothetical protein